MRMRAALCSVASAALWASSAAAQVSIPLPQRPGTAQPAPAPAPTPAPSTPPTSIPLPGAPTPTPAPTPTEPDLGLPQVPMGPYGRPDINPYDRDIDMTVPLTFLNRSLGDIPMRLTADDRFLLETSTFLKLLKPILNDEAHAQLTEHLAGKTQFGPEDLSGTGVGLTYDPSTLAVVVVQVGADQRSTVDLFAPPKDDLDDITLQPESFSAFLNLSLIQTYIWEGSKHADPPTINFDGAVRVGPVVFEGDAQLGQQFTLNGESYKFQRNYARLVYDQPEQYRRWFIGDLDVEIRGQQAYTQMGGIGVLRQKRRFNTFRSAILQADRQLILQRESTVRFLRNGSLYRELRLQPGRYDFSSLPLVAGSNDIEIQVTDNSGAVQNLSYQQYLDPIDLDPGDYEYGAYLGPMSKRFGYAPDYKGPVVFSGFYRKAFFNAPAVGVGLQVSKDVQTLTGQTQFVLGNGGRILLDAAGSHSKVAGVGFTGGASYEHYFDRGGLSDSLTLRVDYTSPDFSTVSNIEGINSASVTASAQYTHQFSQKFLTSSTASYIKGRGTRGDSYRIATNGYYRFNPEWTFRAGVEYTKFQTSSSATGFSVLVGLVFQPDYRRRAEARYQSRNNLAELSYNQSGLNQLNSVGFGGVLTRQDNSAQAVGYVSYSANRFDATLSHATFGPGLSSIADINATTLRVGTTIAYTGGMVGLGRRINDSFMLLKAHENLGKRDVVVGQSLAQNNYIARSGPLGAAVHNFLGSYSTQSVQYDVQDPPPGYDTGPGVFRVHPPYKSGYAARVGTDAFASAMGTLMLTVEKPVSLIGGRVTLLDVKEGDNPQPTPFFTNSVGRFAVSNLLPGRRYLVETYGPNGTVDKAFEFTVPADTTGLVNLGTVKSGSFK